MLTSYEAVKAEHEYRREVLRDQYQKKMSVVSKGAAAVVLASVLAAACGAVVTDDGAPVADRESNVVVDAGPVWQPNGALFEEYLAG